MCLLAGNVLLLVVLVAGFSQTVRTYLLVIILGVELLVVVSCLLYYTGKSSKNLWVVEVLSFIR